MITDLISVTGATELAYRAYFARIACIKVTALDKKKISAGRHFPKRCASTGARPIDPCTAPQMAIVLGYEPLAEVAALVGFPVDQVCGWLWGFVVVVVVVVVD